MNSIKLIHIAILGLITSLVFSAKSESACLKELEQFKQSMLEKLTTFDKTRNDAIASETGTNLAAELEVFKNNLANSFIEWKTAIKKKFGTAQTSMAKLGDAFQQTVDVFTPLTTTTTAPSLWNRIKEFVESKV